MRTLFQLEYNKPTVSAITSGETMNYPETMDCIEIKEFGDAEALSLTSRPVPKLKQGEVLIEVSASGINRPDIFQRKGNYPPPKGVTDIPGLEVAGRVFSTASDVSFPKPGDLVCALLAGGGYAEYAKVPAEHCLPLPSNLTMEEGAALPEAFFTVWNNIMDRGQLKSGESFLVHGGASGIGTTAIQIASSFGAKVLATASSSRKCKICIELGAKQAIDYSNEDFVEAAHEFSKGKGINLILDMVGGDYIPRNIKCLAHKGRLVSIAFLRGSKYEVNFMPIMLKQLTLTGSTLRPESSENKAKIAQALFKNVWPLIEKKEIAPVLFKTFPLAKASEAHRLMETNTHIGKIVLTTNKALL